MSSKDWKPFYNISIFRVFVVPGTANEDYFKSSADPYVKIIWKDRIQPFLQTYQDSGWTAEQSLFKGENLAAQITTTGAT